MDDGADRVALVCARDNRRLGLQVLLREDAAGDDGSATRLSFPVGRVEEGDHAVSSLDRCCGMTGDHARRALGHGVSSAKALGYWVAGARLLLTTTRLLFAVKGAQGAPVPQTLSYRERPLPGRDAKALASHLARHDLYCDLDRLCFFSRWTDPHARTAVGFFLVRIPDDLRVAAHVWRAPDKVLIGWRKQEFHLDFPTFSSLRMLADFSSCDALFSEYASR